MNQNEHYTLRAFDLARLGKQLASPNPNVGALLVADNLIIGEGFTSQHGGNHAEVNAVANAKEKFPNLIEKATLYVSLEPCTIFGRTPPCTNLIIDQNIPKIVFSSLDKTDKVYGESEKILRKENLTVVPGVLKSQGNDLARIRNTFVSKKRPYIILKYAQSKYGFMGNPEKQVWFTNKFSKTLVHKWRSECDAIIIGTITAKLDNPSLTNRLYFGPNPLRIILDRKAILSHDLNIFDGKAETWIITRNKNFVPNQNVKHIVLDFDENLIQNILTMLFEVGKSSLIIEGGAQLLNYFIKEQLWDEARVFVSENDLNDGVKAPCIEIKPVQKSKIMDDELFIYRNHFNKS